MFKIDVFANNQESKMTSLQSTYHLGLKSQSPNFEDRLSFIHQLIFYNKHKNGGYTNISNGVNS